MPQVIYDVTIAVADFPNKNKRIYPKALLEGLVQKQQVASIPMFGMMGADSHSLNIELEKVSHIVDNLRMVGNDLVADIRILDTPMGKILGTLRDNQIPTFFRLSGRADIKFDDDVAIVTNFAIRSIDVVANGA